MGSRPGGRPADRPGCLDGDETADPHGRACLDHGIEVGVWQNRLEERYRDVRFAPDRSVSPDPGHHSATDGLDHLELVLAAVRDCHPTLPGMDPENPGKVMPLRATDGDPTV